MRRNMITRIFKVIETTTGETCAVFGTDQRNMAITLADSLGARAVADGHRYIVTEETVIHETGPRPN